MQVDILQGVFAGTVLVGEVDVLEVDVAVGDFVYGVLGVVQIRLFMQHFAYTADAGKGHAYHYDDHAEHHQAHEQAHYVAEEAGQVAGGEVPGDYELRAHPRDHDDAEVNGYHHRRVVEGEQAFCLDGELVEHVAGLVELLALIAFADESLHHTDSADVFLHACVQIIVTAENFVEYLESYHHDDTQDYHQEYDRNEEGGGDLGADVHRHGEAEDEVQGSAHGDTRTHHKGHLYVRYVRGHTGDQAGYRELVNIGKREGLYVVVYGLAQVRGETGGGVCCKLACQCAEYEAYDAHADHYQAVTYYYRQIARLKSLVN